MNHHTKITSGDRLVAEKDRRQCPLRSPYTREGDPNARACIRRPPALLAAAWGFTPAAPEGSTYPFLRVAFWVSAIAVRC
jgi:hypothetical protein